MNQLTLVVVLSFLIVAHMGSVLSEHVSFEELEQSIDKVQISLSNTSDSFRLGGTEGLENFENLHELYNRIQNKRIKRIINSLTAFVIDASAQAYMLAMEFGYTHPNNNFMLYAVLIVIASFSAPLVYIIAILYILFMLVVKGIRKLRRKKDDT